MYAVVLAKVTEADGINIVKTEKDAQHIRSYPGITVYSN